MFAAMTTRNKFTLRVPLKDRMGLEIRGNGGLPKHPVVPKAIRAIQQSILGV
jgi:hypothetical protein